MQKYIVEGELVAAESGWSGSPTDVYLASAVDAYRNASADIIAANGRELTRMVARINELEKALKPFADASKNAEAMREFVTQVRRNPVDGVASYIWWCSRSLCVDDFKQAINALMES